MAQREGTGHPPELINHMRPQTHEGLGGDAGMKGIYACFHICLWMSGWMSGYVDGWMDGEEQMGRVIMLSMLGFLCSPLQIHSPLSPPCSVPGC